MTEEAKIAEELKRSIRDIPDFPKKGILFKDITTLLQDAKKFKDAVDYLVERYKSEKIDKVVAIEARGFIFGGVAAYKLGAGLVPVRKKGKLPYKTNSIEYDLEYGTDSLEMHEDAISANDRVLIIDDLLATGGTMNAVCELVERSQGKVVEVAFLIELNALKGRERLKDRSVFSLIKF